MHVRRAPVEGAAAVDEHRAAPAAVEVLLVLHARRHQLARADAEVAEASPEFAIVVAADAPIAPGVEPQARWRVYRKSVVCGRGGSDRVDLRGKRNIKKHKID